MGRIRSVKPEILTTPHVASLPDLAWRIYVGIYSLVDDAGRTPADPAYISGSLLWAAPRALHEVQEALLLLAERDLIAPYQVSGVAYLEVSGWRTKGSLAYQVIDHPQLPKYPGPNSTNGSSNDSTQDPIRSDPKGTERKGKRAPDGASPSDLDLPDWAQRRKP